MPATTTPKRRDGVADHVKVGAPDVEVVLRALVQPQRRSRRFTTIATAATPIIIAPLAGSGCRIRATASHPMTSAISDQRDAR